VSTDVLNVPASPGLPVVVTVMLLGVGLPGGELKVVVGHDVLPATGQDTVWPFTPN
jgi:hypothetical protein